MRAPWEWRKANGGFCDPGTLGGRIFHACDVNSNFACYVHGGIMRSCEQPNEGSTLCPDCIEFVKANPAGRDLVVYPT